MSGHQWEYFDFNSKKRCTRCGIATHAKLSFAEVVGCSGSPKAPLVAIGVDRAAAQPDGTVVVRRVATLGDAHVLVAPQLTPQEIQAIETMREIRSEIEKVCGLPPFGKVEAMADTRSKEARRMLDWVAKAAPRKHVSDAAWPRLCGVNAAGREQHELAYKRNGIVLLTVEEHDALTCNGSADEWRQIAQARQAVIESVLKRIAVLEASQDYGEAAGQIEHLDRENARLRRELAEAKASRDGWHDQARTLMSLTAGLRKRLGEREDNVTYVEPFPEVKPYDGDWIAPSHKPRMLP